VISSPVIQSPITEGRGRITGQFTLDEVRGLVIQLKYGSLPVPLKVVQNRTVGPTLGADSVQRSIVAGIIGLILVALFMLIYYRLPGLLADLALIVYSLVVFALFKLIPVTLTLAGIAGFILSIGMAVDANILIFERMREELRHGKSLGAAIEAGYNRAWTSIRDSNISTLITCVILFWFGTNFGASIIKGFALTLAIGVLVSMFSALLVTRNFLRIIQTAFFPGAKPGDGRINWLFGVQQPEATKPESQSPTMSPLGQQR
jgi:preprotein translocase subunit SecD